MIDLPQPRRLGQTLSAARRCRNIKQAHLAEMLGVSQSTVCRIERGEIDPEARIRERVLDFVSAKFDPSADAILKRLIEASCLPMHLVCDVTHRLLAVSKPREQMWGATGSDLTGRSLWRYASEGIQQAEAQLDSVGWGQRDGTNSLIVTTKENASPGLKIWAQIMSWERVLLSDGSAARLDSLIKILE